MTTTTTVQEVIQEKVKKAREKKKKKKVTVKATKKSTIQTTEKTVEKKLREKIEDLELEKELESLDIDEKPEMSEDDLEEIDPVEIVENLVSETLTDDVETVEYDDDGTEIELWKPRNKCSKRNFKVFLGKIS